MSILRKTCVDDNSLKRYDDRFHVRKKYSILTYLQILGTEKIRKSIFKIGTLSSDI